MQIDSAAAAAKAGYPVIECLELPQQEGWACPLWIIESCPYCCERHVHGAGEGFRSSHCASPIPHREFYLIKRGESR
jgi:hypothetical protein